MKRILSILIIVLTICCTTGCDYFDWNNTHTEIELDDDHKQDLKTSLGDIKKEVREEKWENFWDNDDADFGDHVTYIVANATRGIPGINVFSNSALATNPIERANIATEEKGQVKTAAARTVTQADQVKDNTLANPIAIGVIVVVLLLILFLLFKRKSNNIVYTNVIPSHEIKHVSNQQKHINHRNMTHMQY